MKNEERVEEWKKRLRVKWCKHCVKCINTAVLGDPLANENPFTALVMWNSVSVAQAEYFSGINHRSHRLGVARMAKTRIVSLLGTNHSIFAGGDRLASGPSPSLFLSSRDFIILNKWMPWKTVWIISNEPIWQLTLFLNLAYGCFLCQACVYCHLANYELNAQHPKEKYLENSKRPPRPQVRQVRVTDIACALNFSLIAFMRILDQFN